ncbi:phosphate ABC transporter permease PstA [Aerococcaceae bacterium NML191292]|nr:phosphate ABC transporter permease PstA [Aerococcaceae bacterium NML191292]MCW6661622.1 phosphate ABC transporter permease PstA [Aerococcaceae bacterium NML201209]MCW6662613.1 phosphate ABC transporter permease PstA [Aerococcaceae bacterium NML190073]MCW6665755.1 phosphate ABC transporter permease PstA [Aerococcaceae bacterium NML191219]MCW6680245.1 phosphate ABC transporter permease PstA [Aerococcaceae bacterium NML130460]MDO4774263.1 phosphate ABC transporter permease PstA [Aerococcaceae 
MKRINWVKGLIWACAMFTLGILLFIIGFIVLNGLTALKPELFAWQYTTDNVSMLPAIISTLILVAIALAIAVPIGVFTGFYLVEYANRKSRFVHFIRLATDTLSAIPSIVYGLFGMLLFVIHLKFQFSMMAGILTVVIMVLPVIISSTEEGLLSVNNSLRMGSLALGAGKLRTIFTVVLPVAMPGILSGIILAVGRIVGETAALLFTLGSATGLPQNLMSSSRTLALHMYVLSSEGLHIKEAYATGTIIILLVVIINGVSTFLSKKLSQGGK